MVHVLRVSCNKQQASANSTSMRTALSFNINIYDKFSEANLIYSLTSASPFGVFVVIAVRGSRFANPVTERLRIATFRARANYI